MNFFSKWFKKRNNFTKSKHPVFDRAEDALNAFKVYACESLYNKYSKQDKKEPVFLAAAVINEIFMVQPSDNEGAEFLRNNKVLVEKEIQNLHEDAKLCQLLRQSVLVQSLMPYFKKGYWGSTIPTEDLIKITYPVLRLKNWGLISSEDLQKIVDPEDYSLNVKNFVDNARKQSNHNEDEEK